MAPADIVNALKAQNIQAAVGRIGAQPMTDDQLFQLNIQTKGRLTDRRGIRECRGARQSRRLVRARPRYRPGRTWRAESSDTGARYNGKPAR